LIKDRSVGAQIVSADSAKVTPVEHLALSAHVGVVSRELLFAAVEVALWYGSINREALSGNGIADDVEDLISSQWSLDDVPDILWSRLHTESTDEKEDDLHFVQTDG
jgi:hypothetical protein